MHWLLDTANTLGLLLLIGGPVYRALANGAWGEAAVGEILARRVFIVMAFGLIVFLATSLLAISDQNPMFTHTLLASVFFMACFIAEQPNFGALRALAVFSGAGLLLVQVQVSHAAAEPGFLPLVAVAMHWLAAATWGGAALHIALQPWRQFANSAANGSLRRLLARYALLSLVAVALLALSGGLLAFVHIHNADAMSTSVYGSAFRAKSLVVAVLLFTLTINLLGTRRAPGATPAEPKARPGLRRSISVEALVVAAAVAATGVLAVSTPPALAPFLNPQTWIVGEQPAALAVALQPVAGRVSRVRFEIASAQGSETLSDSARVHLSMLTDSGDAGVHEVEALPIGQATFLAETVLARPGQWRLELIIDMPDGASRRVQETVSLPGPPLESDMRAALHLTTIAYSSANVITFVTGLLLFSVALWSARLCLRRAAPGWLMPFGFVSALVGGFLVLSVMFVKTYPSSFWPNPQPYTAPVIRDGDALYREHCADCHGLAGRGDGPWAVANRGSIPDLTAPHMDTHTDGEMYWWNRYGIPSLAMPALGDELDDDENWKIINFVRSLRHGMPPEN